VRIVKLLTFTVGQTEEETNDCHISGKSVPLAYTDPVKNMTRVIRFSKDRVYADWLFRGPTKDCQPFRD
jgi:hypothetical protein